MSNDFFRFKRFTVWQDKCAMKVGTDSVILGAWAKGGRRVLDIGTGTGLLALMMAQRFTDASVTAIDIDCMACLQADENVKASPFSRQIKVICSSLQDFVKEKCSSSEASETFTIPSQDSSLTANCYDSIICNPPFYDHALTCPNARRDTARHATSLTYGELFNCAYALLSRHGAFSAIIPAECRSSFVNEAAKAGLHIWRTCSVITTAAKPPRRYMLTFGKRQETYIEDTEIVIGSRQYKQLTKDFYL